MPRTSPSESTSTSACSVLPKPHCGIRAVVCDVGAPPPDGFCAASRAELSIGTGIGDHKRIGRGAPMHGAAPPVRIREHTPVPRLLRMSRLESKK
ncbi:Uncharacterised protein [Mycobacteroides abscessus subsp. abscessus]|nr:Uncharacterised protein [Mycobacteroides abscessus subsp. abscessus]